MQQPKNLNRLLRALSRQGLDVSYDNKVYSISLNSSLKEHWQDTGATTAEVLLPEGFPVEAKALKQLANLANVRHPEGGCVCRACATPDFHPGDAGVAIGSIVETAGMVISIAVGSDINCGMRLHVADLSIEQFLAKRDRFVELMKGDYFFGTRDVSMTAKTARAMFQHGIPGWLDAMLDRPTGSVASSDFEQLVQESDSLRDSFAARTFLGGSMKGDVKWAPEELVPNDGIVRDGGLATIGGGNHFVEIQVVEEVVDRATAYTWGVRSGQIAFMIHKSDTALGLTGVDCITLRQERRIEEAPAAYKPIQPVIAAQVEAQMVDVVAKMKPVLTFKA
ncbi:MAG: hypothetical protein HC789_17065 [Microcoleus sp. CSU_2_2]|nr:hypothetical protein [Microcoleus sp. SU_5_3]NJS11956.1 hypothetical protein [Microcoleus sp. CSU_2_2]